MDFSSKINLFKQSGSLTPVIDDGGNVYLSVSSTQFSQHYIALPLQTSRYNTSSIEKYYPIEFSEFIPTSTIITSSINIDTLNNQISTLQITNEELTAQLNNIITQQQINSPVADAAAAMQVIINLRVSLGQGKTLSDFSTSFPYSPLHI